MHQLTGSRGVRQLLIAGVSALSTMLLAAMASAQSSVHVRVSAAAVAAGDSVGVCRFDSPIRRYGTGKAGDKTPEDTLLFDVYADSSFAKHSAPQTPLQVWTGSERLRDVGKTDTAVAIFAPGAGLADRVVRIQRANSTSGLCSDMPFPNLSTAFVSPGFVPHTDIIASGEVSNALRTGAMSSPATGSLGFHHRSYRTNPRQSKYWLMRAIDNEELRAVISIAASFDSVTGPAGGNFAQSVLLPTIAPNSGWKSVDLEYFPSHTYGRQNQMIGPAMRIIASESRWAPDTVNGVARTGPAKVAVLLAFDARIRWIAINRVATTDNNSLSFTLDGGYIQRSVGGDASNDAALVRGALGEDRTRFTGWAVGTYLRLRQVTAYADFQCLSCKLGPLFGRSGSKIESLEGLQPIIGFRFEAPFFTVLH
jgi:hypothetical protein